MNVKCLIGGWAGQKSAEKVLFEFALAHVDKLS